MNTYVNDCPCQTFIDMSDRLDPWTFPSENHGVVYEELFEKLLARYC